MQVSVLASGSKGNATFVAIDGAKILVDAGISATRIKKALAAEGVEAADLDAVLLTHEHSDHIAGLRTLTKWYRLPIYSRAATLAHLPREIPRALCHAVEGSFRLAGVQVLPFSVPHDAADPVGYRITGGQQVTTCTDLGFVTSTVQAALEGSDVLVLEANHDPAVLKEGRYPWPLKRRILGTRGHLANADAAWAIARLKRAPQQVFLAHLSAENNRPELARETVETILARQGVSVPITVTSQEQPVRLHETVATYLWGETS